MVLKPPVATRSDGLSSEEATTKPAAPLGSVLGRRSGGFCFAFPGGRDSREYIVGAPQASAISADLTWAACMGVACRGSLCYAGTDDGSMHMCAMSSADKYLDTYRGHLGPVYAVRWSPFHDGVFLSASADCTTRLWCEGQARPLMPVCLLL